MLALCYAKLGKIEDSDLWFKKAVEIKPYFDFLNNYIKKKRKN